MAFVERELPLRPASALSTVDNPFLSIVIPTWNGGRQLAATLGHLREFRAGLEFNAEIVVVDDCSESSTAQIAETFVERNDLTLLLRNERNRGKGHAVARGMLNARGTYRIFVDSDLAYPSGEIAKLLQALEDGSDVAIACRVHPESRYVMSPTFFRYLYTRHVMSRLFNRLAQQILVPGILDTQAGLKGFTARAAQTVFSRQTLCGFGFDFECLFIARLHGLRIAQVPVDFHYRDEPSSISFARHGGAMLMDLLRVRRNGARGTYV
ncbi:MAG TPA: glycosyltransferase [Gemmatimonadaceae bacterium]|jgi:dolichyl-phosphate beta-glucosyltransferase|nr:glycosyltransferase [Gemmatimonadaceae bacterium]